jgi:histidinol phosphatase-like PHP family hydrolase
MERRSFIKNASLATGMMVAAPYINKLHFTDDLSFQVRDLHVHLDNLTIEQALELAHKGNVKIGILEHPASWAIKDDADLKKYIDGLRKYPVYIGLQPFHIGWSKPFSPELLAQLDYVLMDAQMLPWDNGSYLQIWEFNTYIEDTDKFMNKYMEHMLNVLTNEPIHIFGWTMFLPVCIARDYYTLWTEKRMQQILDIAKKRNIAIEINDIAHTPHDKFILMAKEQGLKFTFGSDLSNNNVGKLAYCRSIAKKCNLKEEDFFIPARKI